MNSPLPYPLSSTYPSENQFIWSVIPFELPFTHSSLIEITIFLTLNQAKKRLTNCKSGRSAQHKNLSQPFNVLQMLFTAWQTKKKTLHGGLSGGGGAFIGGFTVFWALLPVLQFFSLSLLWKQLGSMSSVQEILSYSNGCVYCTYICLY